MMTFYGEVSDIEHFRPRWGFFRHKKGKMRAKRLMR
jgi:hypothetical protein